MSFSDGSGASAAFAATVLDEAGTVLIDDRDARGGSGLSYLLANPVDAIIARTGEEVPAALERLDRCLREGRFAAGAIAYNAGLGLDKPIHSRHRAAPPVLWLGVYDDCRAIAADALDLGEPGLVSDIEGVRLNIGEDEYLDRVARVKEYIAAGDVYQINYTCKFLFENRNSARALFARLRHAHPVPHSAFVNTGEEQIISLSPELFLRREGRRVLTRPMKGTMKRGRWFEEDEAIARSLALDEKNRAENVMIVDLMRNDLGRVCEMGAVETPTLFHVARYASLFQMTSDVMGRLREGVGAAALLRAAFPPGSVTGAPKIRAMEIIDELERESRGFYCGAIGLFRPNGDCLLNVAIRTIVQRGRQCEMGVGSGIVADSDPRQELAETRLKGQFLFAERPAFQLLETMLLREGKDYALLEEHLERMRKSAVYFGWDFPEAALREALQRAALEYAKDPIVFPDRTTCEAPDGSVRSAGFSPYSQGNPADPSVIRAKARAPNAPCQLPPADTGLRANAARVRLLLSEDGQCETQWTPLAAPAPQPVKALLSPRRTDPSDIFLYHKTTRRAAYDADWRDAHERGYFDVIYQNTNGEITEGAITNLIAEIDGQWVTPPLRCGLLPGLWRAHKIAREGVEERVILLVDLLRATRIILGNSVRENVEIAAIAAPDGSTLWLASI